MAKNRSFSGEVFGPFWRRSKNMSFFRETFLTGIVIGSQRICPFPETSVAEVVTGRQRIGPFLEKFLAAVVTGRQIIGYISGEVSPGNSSLSKE